MASTDAEDTLVECTAPPEEMPSLLSNRPSFRPRSPPRKQPEQRSRAPKAAQHLPSSPSGPKSEEQQHGYPATAWSPLASPSSSPTWVEVALSSWASSPVAPRSREVEQVWPHWPLLPPRASPTRTPPGSPPCTPPLGPRRIPSGARAPSQREPCCLTTEGGVLE